jgi:hypothetical protein
MAKALPVSNWQFLQWQIDLRSGSGPLQVMVSFPHAHDALRVVSLVSPVVMVCLSCLSFN